MLADYGIPIVASRRAGSEPEAVAAAQAVGFPVALKTTGAEHKTDVGGVRLRLEPPQLQALREDPWAMVRTSAVEALKLIEPAERAADVPRE